MTPMHHEFVLRVPLTRKSVREAINLVKEADQWPASALTGMSVFTPYRQEPLFLCFVVNGDDPQASSVVGWLNEVRLERANDVTLDGLLVQVGLHFGLFSGPADTVLAGLEFVSMTRGL